MKGSYMKKILFITFLYSTIMMQICHAYQVSFSSESSLKKVKQKIISDLGIIEKDKRIQKNVALIQRYRIVSQYEKQFEDHMYQLRQLDNQIYMLKNYMENLKEIKRWQETIKKEKEALESHIDSYQKKYRDIYFPVIYASFVEMSARDEPGYEKHKDLLMSHYLLPSLIDAYGLSSLSSKTSVSDHSTKDTWVRLSKRGAVAYDGLRSCDTCSLSHWGESKTRKISVSLYRFKPLAPPPQKTTSSHFYSDLPYKVKYWDLNEPDQCKRFYALVKKHFSNQAPTILADIENYMNYLGDIKKYIVNARGQRDQFVYHVDRLHKDYESKINLYTGRIELLKAHNESIKKMNILEGNDSIPHIQRIIEKKEWNKKQQESRFNHHFVIMKSASVEKYKTAIRTSINTIFDQLEIMVKKISLNIETVVSMGQFGSQEYGIIKYQPVYNNLSIDTFVDGTQAGILFDISVTYEQSGAKTKNVIDINADQYIEKANGLNIEMTRIDIPNSDRFFFISKEIKRFQFMKYIREEKNEPETFLKKYDIENYPDNYAMFNVSESDIKGFIQWLGVKTNRWYRLPKQEQWNYAGNKGIYSDTGFRVVYFPR